MSRDSSDRRPLRILQREPQLLASESTVVPVALPLPLGLEPQIAIRRPHGAITRPIARKSPRFGVLLIQAPDDVGRDAK